MTEQPYVLYRGSVVMKPQVILCGDPARPDGLHER